MSTSARLSYGLLVLTLVLAAALHLGGPLLIALFSYFALRQLLVITKRKWLALFLFILVVAALAFAAVYFTRAAVRALPEMAETSIRQRLGRGPQHRAAVHRPPKSAQLHHR
jgi:hypothetical protein